MTLRGALTAIGDANLVKIADEIAVAARQRARQRFIEDQQVRDQPRFQRLAIDPVIGGQRRDRPQDRGPLIIIERAADMFFLGQQHMILHVEDARSVVGAFQMQAEPREPVGVVAQHGPVSGAVEAQRCLLHKAEKLGQFLACLRALGPARMQFDPCAVDGVPHLAGQRGAHRA